MPSRAPCTLPWDVPNVVHEIEFHSWPVSSAKPKAVFYLPDDCKTLITDAVMDPRTVNVQMQLAEPYREPLPYALP